MARIFANREEAGRQLAERLATLAEMEDAIVLALPRGGVPVAFEVARRLNCPLDVFVVRKLGVPWQPELAFGALASGGTRVLNADIVRACRLNETEIEKVIDAEELELARREMAYRNNRPAIDIAGKTVILVDDGLATGATMRAAVKAVRAKMPKQIIVAVPVGSVQTCSELDRLSDVICVCATTPEPFYGVGMWYRDFSQTTDAEVREILARTDMASRQKAKLAAS